MVRGIKKPIMTWSPAFSCALCSFYFEFSLALTVFSFFLIGLEDCCGFGFTTLNQTALSARLKWNKFPNIWLLMYFLCLFPFDCLPCLFVCLLQGTRGDFFVVGYLEDHQPHARVRGRVRLGTSIGSAVRRMYGRWVDNLFSSEISWLLKRNVLWIRNLRHSKLPGLRIRCLLFRGDFTYFSLFQC